jgi:opacity protein-like surface antigen
MLSPLRAASILGLVLAASCASPLQHFSEPLSAPAWSDKGEGTRSVGFSSGWAYYGAEIEAEGVSGALVDEGVPQTGTDTMDFSPRYGGAVKYDYSVTDSLSLGLRAEVRNFEADPISALSATLTADPFSTYHLVATSRYHLEPFGHENRWRPFVGLDLGYIPGVDLGSVAVDYPAETGIPSEAGEIKASSYLSMAVGGGASYLLRDNLSFDMGAFYEWAFTPGKERLKLANLGGAEADIEVWPGGFLVFFGLTWFF